MPRSRDASSKGSALLRLGSVVGVIVAALVTLHFPGMTARAAEDAADQGSAMCLGCHGSAGLEKKLDNAETLSLYIPGDTFAKSVHGGIGCTGCHSDIKLESHPPSNKKMTSKREYSVRSADVCRGCHEEQSAQWEGSIHAALVRSDHPVAPVCTDCHLPHSVGPAATLETMDAIPCKRCHGAVFDAYAGSVHGRAKSKGTPLAPICSGCHGAHEVSAADLAGGLKNTCLGCHANALDAHSAWLPNAGLHFDAVSCSACHVPASQRKVDLRLYDSAGQQISEQEGVPLLAPRARSADPDAQGLDPVMLWRLLQTFNREGTHSKTVLRGRLEVRSGVEAHQLADKTKAISDCRTCHREGADAFQSVTITIAGPDGRPLRYGASKDVLSSVISVDSVRGFYAIGGTRIRFLDFVFGLALLGGIAIPAGHITAKWYFRRYLLREATKKSSSPDTSLSKGPRAGGDDSDRADTIGTL
jgi:hypothetical protein